MSAASEIQLLISDVDGTLVHADKTVGAATIAAVRRLRDAGLRFTLVSSRPPQGMRYPREVLDIREPFAAFNGGSILDSDGQVLKAHRVAPDAAALALQVLAREHIEAWVYADDRWLVLDPLGEYVPRERRTIASEPVVVRDYAPYLDRVDKIVAASSGHARLAAVEKTLAAALQGRARAVRSQAYYLDITSLAATKGEAVTALAGYMGVPMQRVAVIGDALNDLPMFQRAALAIAMGQADAAVQQGADFVTASNADDGVASAIDRLLAAREPSAAPR